MKIFLLNPYFKKAEAPVPSLGLLSMATHLRRNGIMDVTVCEPGLGGISREAAIENAAKADIVGISCYTDTRFEVIDFATEVKQKNPSALILLGGCHAGFMAGKIMEQYPVVDCIVDGDGEEPLLKMARGEKRSNIEGLYYREGGVVKNTTPRLKRRFQTVPLDYDFLGKELSGWKDMEAPQELMSLKHLPVIASKGCPYDCSFCATQALGQWRQADAQTILDEVKRLRDDYGARYLRFYDPLFAGNDKAIIRFCDLAEKEGITDVKFRIDIRADMKFDVLKRLKDVGLSVVGFGVESGADKILSDSNKRITRETTLNAIENIQNLGLWMIGYFILFLPGESDREREATLEMVQYFDEYNIQYFKIYPGTDYYRRFVRDGHMTDDFWFDRSKDREMVYCAENFPSCPYTLDKVIGTTIENSSPFWKEYILKAEAEARESCAE